MACTSNPDTLDAIDPTSHIFSQDWNANLNELRNASTVWADYARLKSINSEAFNSIDTDSSGKISLTQLFKYIIDGEIEEKTAIGKNIIISDFTPSKHTDCSVRGPALNRLNESILGLPKKIEPDNLRFQRFENT